MATLSDSYLKIIFIWLLSRIIRKLLDGSYQKSRDLTYPGTNIILLGNVAYAARAPLFSPRGSPALLSRPRECPCRGQGPPLPRARVTLEGILAASAPLPLASAKLVVAIQLFTFEVCDVKIHGWAHLGTSPKAMPVLLIWSVDRGGI